MSDNSSGLRTILGLFGAPLAWVAQMSLCEPLAARACHPFRASLFAPLWVSLPLTLAAISAACGALALLAGIAAWSMWRRTRGRFPLIDDYGRARFLASLAVMSSFIFTIAVFFTSCAIMLVAPCYSGS